MKYLGINKCFCIFVFGMTILGVIVFCCGFLIFRNALSDISPQYMDNHNQYSNPLLMNHNRLVSLLMEIDDNNDINELEHYPNIKTLYNKDNEKIISSYLDVHCSFSNKSFDNSGSWMSNRFDTIIIIVIDALRYDFLLNSETEYSNILPYHNRLDISSNMDIYNGSSWSCAFIADPPTVTLQRVSGIASGTLSTFMEAAFNFGEYESLQDNLLLQLKIKHGIDNIYFFGDSTWISIYPHILIPSSDCEQCDESTKTSNKIVPYYSFHLFDLDTVDNGVKNHLFSLFKNDSLYSPVIISHFLGVDHCGHMYGPNSHYMSIKLDEMNQVIHNIIRELHNHPIYKQKNTLLAIFGDHGMTEDGDHGGPSVKELTAGLAFYSNNQLSIVSSYEKLLEMHDGIHGNDTLLYEWIPRNILKNELELVKDLYRHRGQDLFRSSIYSNIVDDKSLKQIIMTSQIDFAPTICLLLGLPIPFSNIGSLIPELLWSIDPISWFKKDGPGYMDSRNTSISCAFTRVRIQNILYQILALRLVLQQMLVYILKLYKLEENGFDKQFIFSLLEKYSRLGISLSIQAHDPDDYTEEKYNTISDIFIDFLSLTYQITSHGRRIWSSYNVLFMQCGIIILIFVLLCCLYRVIRNNTILHHYLSLFIILYLSHILGLASSSWIIHEDKIITFLMSTILVYSMIFVRSQCNQRMNSMKRFKLFIVLMLLIRLSQFTGLCREEQHPHCKYYSHRDISIIHLYHSLTFIWFTIIIIVSFILTNIIIYLCTSYYYSNKSPYPCKLIHHILFQCIHLRWWTVWIQEGMNGHLNHNPVLKSIFLVMDVSLSISVLAIIFVCICICWIKKQDNHDRISTGINAMLPLLYLVQRPFTGFMFTILSLGQSMVSDMYFEDYSPLSYMIYMYFQSHQLFFSSGHQFTLTGIQWEAAYVGLRHHAPQIVCAIFVALNTFASQLFMTRIFFIHHHKQFGMITIIFILYLCPLIIGAIGCLVLRHHLMLWKIFTPRWLYQVIVCIIIMIFGCAAYNQSENDTESLESVKSS